MQVPILYGIYVDETADFRTSYPINMIPTPKPTGINQGYMRMADGIVGVSQGSGVCRGGIEWDGVIYRVMGTDLVSEASDGALIVIGSIPGTGTVSMAYSFDHLGIVSSGRFFLYDKSTLAENTDPDLGVVTDVEWVDGYFVLTDSENLIVTELGDPFSINPLKYGSSEVDPDPVVGVIKLRNEITAVNRYSIETYQNTGGANFPFTRVNGAQIHRGAIGTHMAAEFMSAIAFVGGGRNESYGVWLGVNGQAAKISTAEIDLLLQDYTETQLASGLMEVRVDRGHETLIIHLPDKTLCYDGAASKVVQQPVWYSLSTSTTLDAAFDARHLVWAYGKWSVGRATANDVGYMTRTTFTHWGGKVSWEFGTPIVYNEGNGLQIHEVELVALAGSAAFSDDARIGTQYSEDGVIFSQMRDVSAASPGQRAKRLRWSRQGEMRNWRVQRFRGSSNAPISPVRIEATVEPLTW